MKSTAMAIGESFRHNGFNIYAAKTKTIRDTMVNNVASDNVITPVGSSLLLVLGFALSIFLSMILLSPNAPDLAPTIAMVIHTICLSEGIPPAAIIAPVNANGRAKMECENLIILR
jgi:hypothetical protein